MEFSAIIVAAGSSERAGPGVPKPWRWLGGKPILRWSVEAFLAAGARTVIVVVAGDRISDAQDALADLPNWRAVPGGANRALSVQAGLEAIRDRAPEHVVLIHDAARPFLTSEHVQSLLDALETADGAIPARPVADTLKRGNEQGLETVSRAGLWQAQTPQAFRLEDIARAYASWSGDSEPTDDAAVLERAGGRVVLVPGDPMLMKLTYPEDFAMAERLVNPSYQVRIGQGLDAHRWGPGTSVWLCGVEIPHDQTLMGHSDADAGLHALTDALLGAIGEGDIGAHFPPSDPKWRGAASDQFLRHAADLIARRGGRIVNVDVTLVCEAPRIGPHRDAMRNRIAEILGVEVSRVSVKATTTEGMGFTGRGEGLMAQAVAMVETPA